MRRVHHRRSSYTLRLVTAATIFVASIFGVVRLTAADDGPRTVENSIGMKLTLIAPGKFMMGTKEERAERTGIDYNFPVDIRDEHSQHEVRITRPFYLGTYTVTRGQFRKFVAATKYKTDAEKDPDGGWGYTGKANIEHFFEQRPEFNWRNPGFDQTDEHPVVLVSWNDAEAFCAWLGKKEHRAYRLPTEAEWEYACRAGTTTQYFFGDRAEDLAKYANLIDTTTKAKFPQLRTQVFASDGFVFTAPVGSYRPNPFGLYDMHGNVQQFCSDWYDPNYYEVSPTDDPQGPADGLQRVVRGGSWYSAPILCRSASRAKELPTISRVGFVNGFRVAVSFPNNEAVGKAALNGTASKSPRTTVPKVKGTGSPRTVDPSSADIPGLADAHQWLKAQTKSPPKVAKLLETVDKAAEQRQAMRMLFDSNWMKSGHPEMIYLVHGEFFPFELSKEQFVGLGGKATSMTTGLWPNGGGAVSSPLVKLSDLVIDRIGGEEGEPNRTIYASVHCTQLRKSARPAMFNMFIPLTNGWTEPTFVSKKALPQDGIVHLEYTLPRLNNAEVIHGLQPVFVGYCTQWVLPDLGDGYKLNSNTVAAILDVPKDDKSSSGSDAKAPQRPPAKRYYSGARLIATVLRMVGPAPVDVPKQLQLKAGDRIIAISDSVTSDVGNLGDVDHILSGTYPDLKIPELIDAGVNGQMAEDLVLRFKQDVVEQKPQWVTISVGINDVLQRLDKPHDPKVLAKFSANVAKMVDMAQAAKIKVILLTPTIIQEDLANEGNRRLLLYAAAEKKIAKAKKCPLVDLHQMFIQALDTKPDYLKRTYLTEDGIHMNLPGGAIVAIGILRALGVPDAEMVKAESAGSK